MLVYEILKASPRIQVSEMSVLQDRQLRSLLSRNDLASAAAAFEKLTPVRFAITFAAPLSDLMASGSVLPASMLLYCAFFRR